MITDIEWFSISRVGYSCRLIEWGSCEKKKSMQTERCLQSQVTAAGADEHLILAGKYRPLLILPYTQVPLLIKLNVYLLLSSNLEIYFIKPAEKFRRFLRCRRKWHVDLHNFGSVAIARVLDVQRRRYSVGLHLQRQIAIRELCVR